MQFKYPEILWALFLLLIPIVIHLFQLRRFKKTPFTNVAMLQTVVSESRKSNNLKKWLLLVTRLLLLAALVLAFSQPFFAKKNALKEKETVIYLDNSFSMQAKKDGFSLLELAVQDLVKTIPKNSEFSLFSNNRTFKNLTLKSIQNNLLNLSYSAEQLSANEILLKSKTLFSKNSNTQKNLVIISDFQERLEATSIDTIQDIDLNLVHLKPDDFANVSIDSLYITGLTNEQIELHINVSGIAEGQSVPISIFDNNKLVAKTAAAYNSNKTSTTAFSLPKNKAIKGRVSLSDNTLSYDNNFYFNIDKKDKIKILTISQTDANFLKRIFTEDEFEFQNFDLKELNYGEIDTQNLILLNGLTTIPTGLQTALQSFYKKGGSLVIIPSKDIDSSSYNALISNLLPLKFTNKNKQEQKITKIAFDHPLYQNVFEKKVSNFDFPQVKSYWNVSSNSANILSLASNSPFLVGNANVYIFTASLDKDNSNFKNTPLIVPTFYNMGINSLKTPELYLTMGTSSKIEIAKRIEKDKVLKVSKSNIEFIPLQESFANKVSLTFIDNPTESGIYSLMNVKDTLKNLSFNFNRKESVLRYQNMEDLDAISVQNNIPQVFEKLAKDNSITEYWKWFIIFAMFFALVEVLIQKFLA